jgi:hypothetical protein
MTVQTLAAAPAEAVITLDTALQRAGLDPAGLVRMAGRGGLAAMLRPCHRG